MLSHLLQCNGVHKTFLQYFQACFASTLLIFPNLMVGWS